MLRIGIVLLLTVVVGCANPPGTRPAPPGGGKALVLLTHEGCVNTETMRINLDKALQALGPPSDYQVLDLASLPNSDVRRGYPTPTLLFANRDVFGMVEPRPPLPEPT
jgi:hypothetical protein